VVGVRVLLLAGQEIPQAMLRLAQQRMKTHGLGV
jgi:hypothetical protein